MKKRFIVAALMSALAIGAVGIGIAVLENAPDAVEHTTEVTFDSRNPERVPAPPRPERQTPLERVVTATPR